MEYPAFSLSVSGSFQHANIPCETKTDSTYYHIKNKKVIL